MLSVDWIIAIGVPVITTETANTTAFAEVQAPVKKTLKNKKKKRAVPAKPRVIKRSNPSAELEKKFEKEYLRKPSMSRMFQMIANEVAENCGATKGSNKPKKRRETSNNL